MKHYTYAHLDPATLVPFYIGKGCKGRYKSKRSRSYRWEQKAAKGYIPAIIRHYETEAEAYADECLLIERMKAQGIKLTNIAPGGEGGYEGNQHLKGYKHTDTAKQKIGEQSKGNRNVRKLHEPIIMAVYKLLDEGMLQKQIASAIGLPKGTVSKIKLMIHPYYKETYDKYQEQIKALC